MNILVVTPYLPYPPTSGGKAAQFSMFRAYPEHYRIRLIYRIQSSDDIANAKALESQFDNLTVILCGETPRSNVHSTAIHKKSLALQLFGLPARATWKLLLLYESWLKKLSPPTKSAEVDKVSSSAAVRLPFSVFSEVSPPVLKAIQSNLEWADLVQADFVDLITLSCLSLQAKPKIFVAYQVHTSYVDTFFRSSLPDKKYTTVEEYHSQLTRLVEQSFLQKFDGIIVFSQEDREDLESIGVDRPVLVSPYTFPLDINPVDPTTLASGDWKRELVFIGSGIHGPNEEGLEWFLEQVYPKLQDGGLTRDRPPLQVVGEWSPEQQQRFHQDTVTFVGFVENLSEAIQGRICICPIRIGAGLRTKLLAAAICSSPIVTTTLGCQGIGMEHETHCLIADNAHEFAAQLLRLLNNIESLAPALASNANQLVTSRFSQEAVAKHRLAFYESMVSEKTLP